MYRDYRKLMVFFFVVVGVNISFAQKKSYTIRGKVIDTSTKMPLEGVYISVVDFDDYAAIKTVETSASGAFEITFTKGKYSLSVYASLYKTKKIPIDFTHFKKGIQVLKDINLTATGMTALDEVLVTGKKYILEKKDGKKIFTIKKDISDVAGSMSNLLSYIPTIIVDIEGNIKIRGQEPRVRINGRSSNLTRKEALQMLPSDMVKKIEVITNPSSSEGAGKPIINIITKKTKQKGLNGGINLATGIPLAQKGGLHVAANTDQLDVYGLYGVTNSSKLTSTEEEHLEERTEEGTRRQEEQNEREKTGISHFAEIGYEYQPSKKSELVGTTSFYTDAHTIEFVGNRLIEDTFGTDHTMQYRDHDLRNLSFSQELEYEIELTKKNKYLEFELQYEYERGKKKESFLETSQTESIRTESSSFEDQHQSEIELEVKYQQALWKDAYLKTGYEYTRNSLDQDQNFGNTDVDSGTINFLKSDIRFSQINHSGFIEYEQDIASFEYRLGVRLENLDRVLRDRSSMSEVKSNFINILPAINIEYKIGATNEVSFGYNKRVRYPRLRFLNPFNTNVDLQNIKVGNPDLDPQTEHNWELEYIKEFKKSTLISTGYSSMVDGVIQYVSRNEEGITITAPQNIGKRTIYGLEVYYNCNPFSWLYSTISINGIYSDIIGSDRENSNTYYALDTSIQNIIRVDPFKIEVSWFYRSPRQQTFQMSSAAIQYVKLGISKRVFKNKGNLVFSVTDPFTTRKQITTIDATNFEYKREYLASPSQFTLSLFLRFNTKNKFRKTDKARTSQKGLFQ